MEQQPWHCPKCGSTNVYTSGTLAQEDAYCRDCDHHESKYNFAYGPGTVENPKPAAAP